MKAAANGRKEIVDVLLDVDGIDVNVQDEVRYLVLNHSR